MSKYLTVWPDPRWWAVGILESHFLVFKRASFLLWLLLPLLYNTHCAKHCFTGSSSVCLKVIQVALGLWLSFAHDKWPLTAAVLTTCETVGPGAVIDHGFKGQISNVVISQGKVVSLLRWFVDVCFYSPPNESKWMMTQWQKTRAFRCCCFLRRQILFCWLFARANLLFVNKQEQLCMWQSCLTHLIQSKR